MKKTMTRISLLALVLIMALTLVACGEKTETDDQNRDLNTADENGGLYTADQVKQILVETMDIDESEVSVEELDNGSIISYGDYGVWFECYILNDSAEAPEFFETQSMFSEDVDKRVDEEDHKVWIEETVYGDDPATYTVIAMKNNLVITISGNQDTDAIINALYLD